METRGVKQFTFYDNYYEIVKYLDEESQLRFYNSIFKYMFEDVEPELKDSEKGIWNLLKIHLDISKTNSNNAKKRKENELKTNEERNENEKETKEKRNENEKETKAKRRFEVVNISNIYISNISNLISNIINYLNNKLNSNYKVNNKKTVQLITKLVNEGYKEEDFYKVIDTKYLDWHDTEYEKFLRPETLFSNKFESYLNQKPKKITTKDFTTYLDPKEFEEI